MLFEENECLVNAGDGTAISVSSMSDSERVDINLIVDAKGCIAKRMVCDRLLKTLMVPFGALLFTLHDYALFFHTCPAFVYGRPSMICGYAIHYRFVLFWFETKFRPDIRGEQETATVPGCHNVVQANAKNISYATNCFHSSFTMLSRSLLNFSLSSIKAKSLPKRRAPCVQSAPTFPPLSPS